MKDLKYAEPFKYFISKIMLGVGTGMVGGLMVLYNSTPSLFGGQAGKLFWFSLLLIGLSCYLDYDLYRTRINLELSIKRSSRK